MLSVKKDIGSLKAKDVIYQLNGKRINDIIDLKFYAASRNRLVVFRNGKEYPLSLNIRQINSLSFEQDIPDVKRCINSCIFCFLNQLPKNLRKTLYFNDDDWRLSFLQGNFITLTNFEDDDLRRIQRQKISPLYISVHCTDNKIRDNLGLKRRDFALKTLEKLDKGGIETHLQIVVCPDINDGQILQNSLDTLQALKNVKSVGIVPVGLTRYRRNGLRIFSSTEAKEIIKTIHSRQSTFRAIKGKNWVYLADEFYLLAGIPVPRAGCYDDLDQLENGIGLVRSWLDNFNDALSLRGLRRYIGGRGNLKFNEILLITGELFGPLLTKEVNSLNLAPKPKVQVIENHFFGGKITVAGLITAQDIIKQVKPTKEPILIPDIMVNDDNLFLDNVSFSELRKSLPSAILVPSSGKLFATWLQKFSYQPPTTNHQSRSFSCPSPS